MKKKKIPDISNPGGEILSYLNESDLDGLNPELGLRGARLKNLSACINREVHDFVKRLNLHRVSKDAKRNNRNLDYKEDIDIAAKELITRISRAPMAVANDPTLSNLCKELRKIRDVISDIQKDPILADFDLKNVYGGSETQIRRDFVVQARAVLRSCSDKAKHIRGPKKDREILFHLVKMGYECAGIEKSDKTISSDITAATKKSK